MSLGAGAPRSGDATRASAAGRRQSGVCAERTRKEAEQVSLGAGAPAFAGDATRAKAAGRRQRGLCLELAVRRRRA